ncbi:aminotransferase class III-fold pyridoxal phosphate-dependent enzyme [Gammaproteobacteria bacterium]|nr:aminotransferase class III-fold pyridoxal phosphate-dependent enzyme [Gammaproteobacteria bacterium]
MAYQFSRNPKKVVPVSTKHRLIKTEIPCSGTKEVLDSLDKYESRSMHGQIPILWDSAKDFNIFDIKGNKFIDFTSAIFFSNVGHSNVRVTAAMQDMLNKPILGCYAYGNEVRSSYLKKLIEFCGPDFDKAFLLSAGTETTEAAFKLMRMSGQSKGKKRLGIISLENNWHGRTMGAQMMSGNAKQKEWIGYDDKDIHHLSFPYPWALHGQSGESFFLKNIDALIKTGVDPKNDLCGMILETFQGWGAVFYPKDFVQAAEKFCRDNDIVLTFDEMQAGFARTGKAFGYQHYDVVPDLICCGKGMGNGYPLSGVIGRGDIMDLPEVGNMSSTHSANPMACAVGLAVIEEIESYNLIEESKRKGKILKDNLNQLKEKSNGRISHILGEGLISAILFKDPETGEADGLIASKIAEKCYEKGVLVVHTGRESIKLGPPLTITDEALLEGLNVIVESFNEVIQEI